MRRKRKRREEKISMAKRKDGREKSSSIKLRSTRLWGGPDIPSV